MADAAGISLFVVDARAPGLSFVPLTNIEGHPCADVRLDGVVVSEDALIGPEGGAGEAIESAQQLLLAAACAEAVGTLKAALDATRDYAGTRGAGQAVTETDDSGLFWFFNADNLEMLVKVLDGCAINGHYWVFAAAATDVEYELTVRDAVTGQSRTWHSPLGIASPAITDAGALAVCPEGDWSEGRELE